MQTLVSPILIYTHIHLAIASLWELGIGYCIYIYLCVKTSAY